MLLAEIADKMSPASFYVTLAVVAGVVYATTAFFLRGFPRAAILSVLVVTTASCAYGFQVDGDLVEAARDELGQGYLMVYRYWIFGAIALAAVLMFIFHILSRFAPPSHKHKAEQDAGDQAPATLPAGADTAWTFG